MEKKINNNLDSVEGRIKEFAGKLLDDEDLEFKGKIQSIKGDIAGKGEALKHKAQGKVNDFIDNSFIHKIREDSCKKD
ncbi:hypothetical protein acsn021_36750 [Anaerocolumna cellulosilytica]|uniref:Uncharacterized protein n=1 Tax=Anaerocolumna cellulosilytica TaxID=433286 RepID=A0A6S6R1X0_9FIRM|nr:CsbD family protein [Anaerocolumna cellulosilytica]MBB5195056.1 uncharacterized protein YjbJ (UPF0337 family) [Anaerocolumna cellulosilytica]BCJ96106.1 hypothetical protein acsn021_36750 [Anaerocolumna cellulosilytica]